MVRSGYHFARLFVAGVLALGSVAAPGIAVAGEPPLPGECASFKPMSEVSVGAMGNGWTVERGTVPERFRFEVLGIVDDGIAPGRDMIIVEVSDAPGNDVFARIGGIWSGMSGSPVYLGNKLLGAIAYGFSVGPSKIGGVTPAVEMADVLDYSTAASSGSMPSKVRVPTSMRASLAARAGVSAADAASFERLAVPFSVSGLNARARTQLTNDLADRSISAVVVPAAKSAKSAGSSISARPVPGGNFAGVVSYGDVTLGGIGTTTYVCGNKALAFGHPLTFRGNTGFGANNANAIAIVDDPTSTPFKLANITGLFGKLDQDRLVGIRAKLNATPAMRTVTSHVVNVDSGMTRNGHTDVTMSDWVPEVAPLHFLANADVVFDQVGKGTSLVTWAIDGVRSNGNAFHLDYTNRYASQSDISRESIFQLAGHLAAIQGNPFTAVRFTGVDIDATFDDTFRSYVIESAKISRNGGTLPRRSSINVSPGDNLRVRVTLRRFQAPRSPAAGGRRPGRCGVRQLRATHIRGGRDFFGESPVRQLLRPAHRALENEARNDDLVADLSSSTSMLVGRPAIRYRAHGRRRQRTYRDRAFCGVASRRGEAVRQRVASPFADDARAWSDV